MTKSLQQVPENISCVAALKAQSNKILKQSNETIILKHQGIAKIMKKVSLNHMQDMNGLVLFWESNFYFKWELN